MSGLGQMTIGRDVRWSFTADDHISGLAWSPDDARLAVCTSAGTLYVLDAVTGKSVCRWDAHEIGATAVDWARGGLASCGQDGKVKLWDAEAGKPLRNLDAGAAWVETLQWAPGGGLLASTAGRKLRIWNPAGELIAGHGDFPSTIATICWRSDGKAIGVGYYGGVQLFRIGESEPYQNMVWKGSILTLAWSPNSRYVAAGSQEATVNFWKLPFRHGDELNMSGYATKVRELAWDKGSRFLATGGGEIITVWDVSGKGPAGTRPRQLEAHLRKVTHLQYQSHGLLLASADGAGHVALWNPVQSSQPLRESSVESAVSKVSWSHNDSAIAWGTTEGEVCVWNVG